MRQAGKKKKRFKLPSNKKDEKKIALKQLKELLQYDHTDGPGLDSGSESDGDSPVSTRKSNPKT